MSSWTWPRDPPGGRRALLLRGALLLGVGALGVMRPAGAASFLVTLASGLAAFVGPGKMFELALGALPDVEAACFDGNGYDRPGFGWRSWCPCPPSSRGGSPGWAGPALALPSFVSDACNGAPDLCGRRLDEVIFPGTHNSMSSADIPDWMFPQQELRHPGAAGTTGIRALPLRRALRATRGGAGEDGPRLGDDVGGRSSSWPWGRKGSSAAMRIRDRLTGKVEGPRGLYLCHGFCELGCDSLWRAPL